MAEIERRTAIHFDMVFKVSESEARALDALAGYGDDEFVKVFYEKLGKAYMTPHEAGLRSFLKSIRGVVGTELSVIDEARKTLARAAQGPDYKKPPALHGGEP